MIRRPPRSTLDRSSAASDVYKRQPIHLLLTDVVMPGMNGVELAKRLRSCDPQLKVVFVSGYADSIILRHGALDEKARFVQKPYRPTLLASKIREVLEA